MFALEDKLYEKDWRLGALVRVHPLRTEQTPVFRTGVCSGSPPSAPAEPEHLKGLQHWHHCASCLRENTLRMKALQ